MEYLLYSFVHVHVLDYNVMCPHVHVNVLSLCAHLYLVETSDTELLEMLAELAGQSSSHPLPSSHPSGDGSGTTPSGHSSSPLGSDIDLFEDTIVKRKGGVVKGLQHKGRSPSSDGYHDDTIPCNQYAEGAGVDGDSRVANVSSIVAMDTIKLHDQTLN